MQTLIESYVADVVRRLPRRTRADVGFELRALLAEELQGQTQDAGRPADEAMTLGLLRTFGHPRDVAARYRPPGLVIIEPAEATPFIALVLGGVALQWAFSLPRALSLSADHGVAAGLGGWWTSAGLGALWWPGFLIVIAMAAAWIRRRWPTAASVWTPRVVDHDSVSRPLWILALAFFLCSIAVLTTLPWLFDQMIGGPGVHRAFVYDDGFRSQRGPWLLPIWAAHLTLIAVLIVRGRWNQLTRRIDMGLSVTISAVMVWIIAAGPVFQAPPTDQIVKLSMAVIVVIALIDAGVKLRRELALHATPAAIRQAAARRPTGAAAGPAA